MAITQEVNIQLLEKLPDGNFKKKNPETKASIVKMNDGTTVEEKVTSHLDDDMAHGVNTKVPMTRKINNKALSADITLAASDVGALPVNPSVITVSANKTLALTDAGTVQNCTNSSAITMTVPANSSVAFPVGTEIAVIRSGAGTVTFSPASGVTLNSKEGKRSIDGQYASCALKKIGTNVWVLVGALTS